MVWDVGGWRGWAEGVVGGELGFGSLSKAQVGE